MAQASSSRVQLAYKPETTFGAIPAPGVPYALRITGESLSYDVTKETSNEINAARSVSSVVATGASCSGGVQGELQYAEWDRFLASLMQSTYTVYGTNGEQGTASTATYTATTITAGAATSGNDSWATLQAGQWFRINAPTGLNAGKFFRVHKTTPPTTTVITLDPGTPASVEASIANTKVQTSRLTNGTTMSSFAIERQSLDVVQYFAYRGMVPSKANVQIQSGALSTISFDFIGKDMVAPAGSTQLPGALTASYGYDIHSGVSGASCQLWMDGAPLTGTYIKSLTLDYDNTLRGQDAMCSLGNIDVASGQIVCNITVQMYLSATSSASVYGKLLNNTYTEISFSSLDASGNGYFFTAPRANTSSVKVNAGAKDQDMMLEVSFQCVRDAANATAALRQVLFIDRVGAAVT